MGRGGGGSPKRIPRAVRVRRLARALNELLHPTHTYRPVIGERDRRKIEIIAFGMDQNMNLEFREALDVFGIVEVAAQETPDGKRIHRAWILNPVIPHELDGLDTDDDTSPTAPGDATA